MRFGLILGFAILAAWPAPSVWTETIYARSNSSGAMADGRSWQTAFASITQAVKAAQPNDEIWIAGGVYHESNVILKPGVNVRGGFSGQERALQDRQPGHRTIVNGQGQPAPIFYGADQSVIDQITFEQSRFAALFCQKTSPTVTSCVFRNNEGKMGGGAFCLEGSRAIFRDCLFENNRASTGGALGVLRSAPLIQGCTFIANQTTGFPDEKGGGGIAASNASFVQIESSTLEKNEAMYGGALLAGSGSRIVFTDARLRWNKSLDAGGAVMAFNSDLLFQQCQIEYNQTARKGGAIHSASSNVQIRSSTLSHNRAVGDGSMGGAVFAEKGRCRIESTVWEKNSASAIGGAAHFDNIELVSITGSSIRENGAIEYGGGFGFYNHTTSRIQNSTFQRNRAGVGGGALHYSLGSQGMIAACVIAENSVYHPSSAGGGIVLEENAKLIMANSQIVKNQCSPYYTSGGGMHIFKGSIAECGGNVFALNYAHIGSQISARDQGRLEAKQCVFFGVSDRFSVAVDCAFEGKGKNRYFTVPSSANLENCLLWNHDLAFPFLIPEQNVNVYGKNHSVGLPSFESIEQLGLSNPEEMDFRLLPGSPLIDAGSGAAVFLGMQPLDGDGDGVARWDIGAFEYDLKTVKNE